MYTDSFYDYLSYEKNYSENTVLAYKRDISQWIEYVTDGKEENFSLEGVTTDLIRSWVVMLLDQGSQVSTVNRKLSSLRSFYKFLKKRGLVKSDPLEKIVAPQKKKPLPSFLRESEMDRLLDKVEFSDDFVGCRDRLIIEMFYLTGIRLSELIGLDDSDVELSTSVLKVLGKGNKQRNVPFGEELKEDISLYLKKRSDEVQDFKDSAFYVDLKGRRLSRIAVYKLVKENLSKVSTLKKCSPHVLRHTFATVMLNNGAELEAVKKILGHTSLAATEVYTHTTFEKLKRVYKQAHPRA